MNSLIRSLNCLRVGGGGSWPPSCISANVYNYILNGFFFLPVVQRRQRWIRRCWWHTGGFGGRVIQWVFKMNQTESRYNYAFCLLNGFGEKRIRFFYFLVPFFVLVFRIKTLQIKYNLFWLNLRELHWMETPIVVRGRCLKDLTGSWVGKIFVLAFKLSRRKYIFIVYEWVLIQYLP